MPFNASRYEFTAEEIGALLDELDQRLAQRGISASIFIVGGAAIAVTSVSGLRRTEDIDAVTRDGVVLEEARLMARENGLPDSWLNTNARMWMPPLPEDALRPYPEPGLHVTYADDNFLLATKLIAQRRKDAGDIIELAKRLGLHSPSPRDLEDLIRHYYTDEGNLEFIIDGQDVDREIRYLSEAAARMLTEHFDREPPTSS